MKLTSAILPMLFASALALSPLAACSSATQGTGSSDGGDDDGEGGTVDKDAPVIDEITVPDEADLSDDTFTVTAKIEFHDDDDKVEKLRLVAKIEGLDDLEKDTKLDDAMDKGTISYVFGGKFSEGAVKDGDEVNYEIRLVDEAGHASKPEKGSFKLKAKESSDAGKEDAGKTDAGAEDAG